MAWRERTAESSMHGLVVVKEKGWWKLRKVAGCSDVQVYQVDHAGRCYVRLTSRRRLDVDSYAVGVLAGKANQRTLKSSDALSRTSLLSPSPGWRRSGKPPAIASAVASLPFRLCCWPLADRRHVHVLRVPSNQRTLRANRARRRRKEERLDVGLTEVGAWEGIGRMVAGSNGGLVLRWLRV
ncbi:hypothetical protein BU24DRAFT_405073 [Aaosphaeria arxii CBS 175.79]|uniref:Uncharacterized protein n=1 Tax=Aaosphaeria arxii CBS 175.79 TaxID=1450172 RepID=A0A6A5YAD7_9PLEO|nr:uncharacterized protein BU24DRAFT_405073 [Aaosphaeria arxii CBS 175.79]KAF2022183.1 hypothetical protein BU24DRAFT_405073 [Aaosphaeria arxii CBS 175.79]